MLERIAADPGAYQLQHGWIEKARRARDARARLSARAAAGPAPLEMQVSGTMRIPVLTGYFSGESAPGAIAIWSDQLFGNNPTGNVTDYWDEVSYNALTMTGDVMAWSQLANAESHYAGTSNGTDWNNPDTHFGEFIKELLDTHDGSVDFGQYDNDGPDGLPNSGDDDGVVDLLALMQSQEGGECTGGTSGHIWSHKGLYSSWNVSGLAPYTTNDARSGGGFIQVNDYTVQPAWNCGGSPDVIDIGIFCHEFGHALGLPDLYDITGNGEGIGHWGIMGSGNWNAPDSPAHPCAWTRVQMGWVTPTVEGWDDPVVDIPQINTSPAAFRLPFTDSRFRRASNCVIGGSWSLYCGLTVAEGTARGWGSPGPNGGYGSSWSESIERTFTLSSAGATPVTFQYDYQCDMETSWDFAYAVIDVQGSETVLATYTGTVGGSESIDITTHVGGLSQGDTYTLRFHVESDFAIADDDSVWDSDCGAFIVDNVGLVGGGENYASDFETYADGWHSPGSTSEYWLVENRQPVGFDSNLHGSGVLIWHVDDAVMSSAAQGNSAGNEGSLVRGVVLEEADGQFNLNNAPTNRGEASDPYPGTTANTDFATVTTPNSENNSGHATEVAVTNIGPSAPTMQANLRGGNPGPTASAVSPNTIDNNEVAVDVAVDGAGIAFGATFVLSYAGGGSAQADADNMVPSSIRWVDDVRIEGTVNPYSKAGGLWDLVVTNPDGQVFTLNDAVTVNFFVPAQLASARIRAVGETVRLEYVLIEADADERFRLHRATLPAEDYTLLADGLTLETGGILNFSDETVEPGSVYAYLLESYRPDGSARELHRGSATVSAGALRLDPNHPNPFNPLTTIPFYLPERTRVRMDVYDVRGAHVATLASGIFSAGAHRVEWNGVDSGGTPAASGVYYLRLRAGQHTLQRKMLLLK